MRLSFRITNPHTNARKHGLIFSLTDKRCGNVMNCRKDGSVYLFLFELPVSDVAEEIILSPSSMSSLLASSFFFA